MVNNIWRDLLNSLLSAFGDWNRFEVMVDNNYTCILMFTLSGTNGY